MVQEADYAGEMREQSAVRESGAEAVNKTGRTQAWGRGLLENLFPFVVLGVVVWLRRREDAREP